MFGLQGAVGRGAQAVFASLADAIRPHAEAAKRDELAQWLELHGCGGILDSKAIAAQAAVALLARAVICRAAEPDSPLPCSSAEDLIRSSNNHIRNLGCDPPPPTVLDSLAIASAVEITKLDLEAVIESGSDALGWLYAASVPQAARRPLGQFWTPWPIAELMARWAIRSPSDRVLDPGFGSGVLLMAAAERLGTTGYLAGTEISPVLFLVALANLLLTPARNLKLDLRCEDFILPHCAATQAVGEQTSSYTGRNVQLSLPGMDRMPEAPFKGPFDVVVCNPPYTRHHHLPDDYKTRWGEAVRDSFGVSFSRLTSLFAYFLIQSWRLLSTTGKMAFITPATMFETFYSRQVKRFLRSRLRPRAIITFDESLSVFQGVDTAACVTLLDGPGTETRSHLIHIEVHRWPGPDAILAALAAGREGERDWGRAWRIPLGELKPTSKWTVLARGVRGSGAGLVPLSQIARIMRGIATGANSFFVLDDAAVARWGIPRRLLRPVLTRNREAPGYAFTNADFERLGRKGKPRWLLYLASPVRPGTPEERYVRHGLSLGLHRRKLVNTRSPWYVMEKREPAPIYYTYLSRRNSRFISNQAGVLALNVFLCIYPEREIAGDETLLNALLAFLNSPLTKRGLRMVGRCYGGDTVKVEPRELDRLPVLDPRTLQARDCRALASLFSDLCRATAQDEIECIREETARLVESLT